ncbi:hypothetical protein CASFOL_030686 [Castilleja foliolosa]|uniref:Uncharacterized protein n=1 Tax=Castilleja foliolosa TaxID=1961234 RepID=A0ABD3C908_9LAMI
MERSMDYRNKNLKGTREKMDPEIESRKKHKAIESGEKTEISMEDTEESPTAKAMALLRKATESGALDYSCFPRSWLDEPSPMIACKGSRNYTLALEMARFALNRLKDDPRNVNAGKTFEVVCVDKIAIAFFDHFVIHFNVREVATDAPLKTLQAFLYYSYPFHNPDEDTNLIDWRWYPSQEEGV